ncbi:hypothetical protein Pmani_012790 [Petrolisthes manimaculis]|uniref:Uncharacterized protein n=1 Tax=Petrolisthes manimaculis TaxID=1843537 RepID=A0AAE1PXU4_9EUCA|nr:hypothetical protein Pmani_012790 [Petrolisthes manimaculis]
MADELLQRVVQEFSARTGRHEYSALVTLKCAREHYQQQPRLALLLQNGSSQQGGPRLLYFLWHPLSTSTR